MEWLDIKVYKSFRDLILDWNFEDWRSSSEGVEIEYVSITQFLAQPDITYFTFIATYPLVYEDTVAFWCNHKGTHFVVLDSFGDINGFYVVYVNGICHHQAFLSKEEAERFVSEISESSN